MIFDSAVSCILKHLLVNISSDFKVYNSASQSVVPGLAAEVSPGDLLETHTPELQLKPSQWETRAVVLSGLCDSQPSRRF